MLLVDEGEKKKPYKSFSGVSGCSFQLFHWSSIILLTEEASCFLNITPAVTAYPLGIIQFTGKYTSKVSTFSNPFLRTGPSPLPRRLAAIWGIFHFLSFLDPSGPHSMFLFTPSALKAGKTPAPKTTGNLGS